MDFFFTKFGFGEWLPGSHPQTNFIVVAIKCGLTAAKIAKIGNFWYKICSKGYIPVSDFLIQNLAWERQSQVPTITPTFTIIELKMWAYGPGNRQKC